MPNAPGQGRPRKPTEIHHQNGNPGHRPLPDPIDVPRDKPDPPLHYDNEHVEAWNYFVDAIHGMGVLSTNDAPAIEMLVDSWVGYRKMQADAVANGYVHETNPEKGLMDVSKWFRVRKTLFEQVHSLLIQFGLTPVARARLAGTIEKPPEETDPLVAMMRKRAARAGQN